MLRFRIRTRPRKMSGVEGLGSGQEGRMKRLRKLVTELIRNERIEGLHAHCDEARGYAEKLIMLAVRNGDKHRPTMETADYWLLEKDLIHKLFKVLVPRYQHCPTVATSLHRLSTPYPGNGLPVSILELKGNPWPPVRPQPRDPSVLLSNVLLEEARKDYNQRRLQQSTVASSTAAAAQASATDSDFGSSVDGTPDSSVDPAPGQVETEKPSDGEDTKGR